MIDFDDLPDLPDLPPFTLESWRIFKKATRYRRYLQRQIECDQVTVPAWLAAVDRDDRTDPYNSEPRAVRRNQSTKGTH